MKFSLDMSKVLSLVIVGFCIDVLIIVYIYYNEILFVLVFFNVDVVFYNSIIEVYFFVN